MNEFRKALEDIVETIPPTFGGTQGAIRKRAIEALDAPAASPFIWICLAGAGTEASPDPDPRIRAWTANEARAIELTASGLDMVPVFVRPPTRDEAFDAYRRTMTRIVDDLKTRLDTVKAETAVAIRNAGRPALESALETIQSLRHVAATDFKSANCQGQRGSDRCDAFFEAYTAVFKLKDGTAPAGAPAQPAHDRVGMVAAILARRYPHRTDRQAWIDVYLSGNSAGMPGSFYFAVNSAFGYVDAILAAQPPAAPVDLTNHHNALKCPYCNPKGLQFAEPHNGSSAATEHDPHSWQQIAERMREALRSAENAFNAISPMVTIAGLGDLTKEQQETFRKRSAVFNVARQTIKEAITYRAIAGEPQAASMAIADIVAERQRHIEVEGWTPAHDDLHNKCEMAIAAAGYALASSPVQIEREWVYADQPKNWPWHSSWWKPGFYRRNLVKAGALIVAEIERWDRLERSSSVTRPQSESGK